MFQITAFGDRNFSNNVMVATVSTVADTFITELFIVSLSN